MKAKELRTMTAKELEEKLNELSKELIKDRATASTGTTPKSPGRMQESKKTIARIHQILAAKEVKV